MKVLVLAGGEGTRLRPLSKPKQFVSFQNNETLLEMTLKRFASFETFVSVGSGQEGELEGTFPLSRTIIEPERKNTGPAICYAIYMLTERGELGPEDLLCVCPSDHYFEDNAALIQAMEEGRKWAEKGDIVLFGHQARTANPHLGYITPEGQFIEKPPLEVAEELVKSGAYWNLGIFLFRIDAFQRELAEHAPNLMGSFDAMPSISIDKALMQKCRKIRMIPVRGKWMDLGSWDAIYEFILEKH